MEEDTNYICPACGSEYFVSSKSAEKVVFKLGAEREIMIIADSAGEQIDPMAINCGACSWSGEMQQTAENLN